MGKTQAIGLALLAFLSCALGSNILQTDGFSTCGGDSTIKVNNLDISFDRSTNNITFDASGTSNKVQNVTAELIVTAYGVTVYNKSFDPCADATKVEQLCPLPSGTFSASGSQTIPSSYADLIPSIAYSVPDLDGDAQLILKDADGQEVACIQSGINNGKSVEVPAVSYVAAGIAAAALVLSAIGALSTSGSPGASSASPQFGEVIGWFQGMAMNGMLSVNYPSIYRKFTNNFAFSTGLIPWANMQISIDSFRAKTGGNLTDASYQYLKNSTLVFADGSTTTTSTDVAKRALSLFAREVAPTFSQSNTTSSSNTTSTSGESHFVSGIQAYVEQLTIPQANTFMSVLLVFAIIVGAIVVGILLFKVILEAWALLSHRFPKSLTTFRKEYWRIMAQTITNLILLLYGVWTLYCIFQFTHGDSWAAKLLAGVTLGLFTGLLGFYTVRIFMIARRLKQMSGDASALYDSKDQWKKYKLFYENYKRGYWYMFLPAIIYMFAKGCVLAAADGHGLVQTVGQLIIEAIMLSILLWSRPFNRRSGNWINVVIQVVRVLSVACILVFVEELGISQTTKTITGVVLIAVQSGLTLILAILIAVNSIISCCKENPHRKRRKAAEKLHHDFDGPTPLDANAMALEAQPYQGAALGNRHSRNFSGVTAYEPVPGGSRGSGEAGPDPKWTRPVPQRHEENDLGLMNAAASMGRRSGHERSRSRGSGSEVGDDAPMPPRYSRQPALPPINFSRYQYQQV